ncbi:MAG: ornithine carbamoyltransferase [Lachnospiraceae bacterium]|jgi:ornithine carbamoyltransferase|nr:ornithine carbamoyltransferase [Lachnospiraceae bacterium]
MNLKGKDFLKLLDFTPQEITFLLDLAAEYKEKKKNKIPTEEFRGRNIALIFEKTSTRTRCAFEVAAYDLGIHATFLDPVSSQIGNKESIADTARVLGSMYDGIQYRGYGQDIVEEIARYSKVPVWNGLTNEFHPTQMLADLLTIREHFGYLEGIRLCYLGDARYNMGNSLMVACAKMGMHFIACTSPKYYPSEELITQCREIAAQTGAEITLTSDVLSGTKNADVIYTDVWLSMGEPQAAWDERIRDLTPYQVTAQVMQNAGDKAVFMHDLPSFHNKETKIGEQICTQYGLEALEVTDEVFESAQSIVFQEAENRMHTIKAVIAATIE